MATFNFTFDPGTTVQQMVGFEMAGRVWSRYLSDAVTINLHAGVSSSLPTNVIGGALPGFQANRAYTTVRDRLYADATSADDTAATNGIRNYNKYADFSQWNPGVDPTTRLHGSVDLFVDGSLAWDNGILARIWQTWFPDADRLNSGGKTYIDLKDNVNAANMALTRANAKALGVSLDQAGNTVLDGYVMLSDLSNVSNVAWNYDYTRSSAAGSNSLDFFSVALHEIGHTLGFVSGVDRPGWLSPFFTTTTGSLNGLWTSGTTDNYYIDVFKRTNFATPLDLFRYNSTTTTHWGGWRDFSVGGTTMFSFNGTTAIANFATGMETSLGGSGLQASHWQGTTGSSGIMNPTLGLGVRREIATLDLRGMDAIGWNLTNNSNAVQTIDLSALRTQSIQSLEARNRNSTTVTTATNALNWYNTNLTRSLTPLVSNRDQEINTMLTNSQVYDMTRVSTASTTGVVTRQVFASMFQQQQGFRSELWEVAAIDVPAVEVDGTRLGMEDSIAVLGAVVEPLARGLTATAVTAEVSQPLMLAMVQINLSWLDLSRVDSSMDHRFVTVPLAEVLSTGVDVAGARGQTGAIAGNSSGMNTRDYARDYDSQRVSRLFTPITGSEKAPDKRASGFEFASELDLLVA
jgi:hypothetical protein